MAYLVNSTYISMNKIMTTTILTDGQSGECTPVQW
jgi:hypothetical protein